MDDQLLGLLRSFFCLPWPRLAYHNITTIKAIDKKRNQTAPFSFQVYFLDFYIKSQTIPDVSPHP